MTRLRRLTPTICAFHLGFSLVGLLLRDVVLTRDEVDGLMAGLLTSNTRVTARPDSVGG